MTQYTQHLLFLAKACYASHLPQQRLSVSTADKWPRDFITKLLTLTFPKDWCLN